LVDSFRASSNAASQFNSLSRGTIASRLASDPNHASPSFQNYLFGCHPHGIISIAPFINFATNGTGFFSKFPNINVHLCTLVGQFWTPFRREWGLLHGMIDCSRRSIQHLLEPKRKGNAVVLVVGGLTLPYHGFQ
jgi:hypothetical protein